MKDTYSSTRKYLRELYVLPGGQEGKAWLIPGPTSEEAGATRDKELEDRHARWRTRRDSQQR